MFSDKLKLDFVVSFVVVSLIQIVSSTNTTTEATASESSNNATWLIIGVGAAFFLILLAIIAGGIVYAVHKKKRVHPHSDTESFYSEETSERDYKSRPTTASHIFIEPGEEAMSKPVTMTPFELRKLYVETFPFTKWKRGFDGSLRPQMPLKFVDPNVYRRTKMDESNFRQSILSYEKPDTLTLRSAAPSRLTTRSRMRPGSNLEPIKEGNAQVTPANEDEAPASQTHQTEAVVHFTGIDQVADSEDHNDDIQSKIFSGDDTEL